MTPIIKLLFLPIFAMLVYMFVCYIGMIRETFIERDWYWFAIALFLGYLLLMAIVFVG